LERFKRGRIIIDLDGEYDTEIYTTIEMMTDEEKELSYNN